MAERSSARSDDDDVETSPADDLALFEADDQGADRGRGLGSAEGTVRRRRARWCSCRRPTPVDGGVAAVRTAFEAATRDAGHRARGAAGRSTGPTPSFGPPGKVADRKDVTDLDTVFVRFDNGVRLTVKSTKFREDQVLVQVRFGDGLEGMAARPPDDHLGRQRPSPKAACGRSAPTTPSARWPARSTA